jgi:pheromone shutdown protein TraB
MPRCELQRSKAVNGSKVVVCVLGAGHLQGVVQALQADQGGDTLRFSGELCDWPSCPEWMDGWLR